MCVPANTWSVRLRWISTALVVLLLLDQCQCTWTLPEMSPAEAGLMNIVFTACLQDIDVNVLILLKCTLCSSPCCSLTSSCLLLCQRVFCISCPTNNLYLHKWFVLFNKCLFIIEVVLLEWISNVRLCEFEVWGADVCVVCCVFAGSYSSSSRQNWRFTRETGWLPTTFPR